MNPVIDKDFVMRRIATKVVRAVERVGFVSASGVQVVCRCSGVVCREAGKYYVETGLVGIDLPQFGDKHLQARLAGVYVN